jgi:hypothetical protein
LFGREDFFQFRPCLGFQRGNLSFLIISQFELFLSARWQQVKSTPTARSTAFAAGAARTADALLWRLAIGRRRVVLCSEETG